MRFDCVICGQLSDDGDVPNRICMGCDDQLHLMAKDTMYLADAKRIKEHFEEYPAAVADVKVFREDLETVKKIYAHILPLHHYDRVTFIAK